MTTVPLTVVARRIAALRELPVAERADAARALLPTVAATLEDERIDPDVARGMWLQLARAVDPQADRGDTVDEARETAARTLGITGPLDVVRALRRADDIATAASRTARAALRDGVVTAVRSGLPATLVAREAGVSRAVLYAWIG